VVPSGGREGSLGVGLNARDAPIAPLPMEIESFELSDELRARLECHGLEFLAEFYNRHTLRSVDDVDVLVELGHLLTRLERYSEGLEVDRRLVVLLPEEPTVHYNLACSLARVAAPDEAFAALDHCVELGYNDMAFLLDDEDLESLREDPRFGALVKRLGG